MAFTKKQKAAVKAIVSCHETGKPVGNYSALVVLSDDAGITFGSHQSTHKSGSLYKIVKMYCDISNSNVSKELEKYLSGLKTPAQRHKYAKDANLKKLLKESGNDPSMRFAQDKVFEVNYFEPAVHAVEGSGWVSPLSLAVVYDSMIQGGWTTVRDRVSAASEKEWIKKYVAARRRWLSGSSRQVVRNSVYRMKTFEDLIAKNNWDLNTPMIVHGVTITDSHLSVWMTGENSSKPVTEIGEVESVDISAPIQNFFLGNTEGIADENTAGGSWEEGDSIEVIEDTDEAGLTEFVPLVPEETVPDNKVTGDPPKAGEPVPDKAAEEGEAIVGGRPQDPPVIIEPKQPEVTSGWSTWKTTIAGFFGTIGVSAASAGTWLWGAIQDPGSARFFLVFAMAAVILAGIIGIVYLIIRAVDKSRRENHAYQITVKELELKSMPDRYNVKVDRRAESREESDK